MHCRTLDWDGFVLSTAERVGAIPIDVYAAIDGGEEPAPVPRSGT